MKNNDVFENILQSIKDGDTKAYLENDIDYQMEKFYYAHNKEIELKNRKYRGVESIIFILLLITYFFINYEILLILALLLFFRIGLMTNELSWYKKWFIDGCKKIIKNQN